MTSISCQAILFDLDGTLIDSWKCIEYAWKTWCLDHNLEYNDLVHRFNGSRAIDIIRKLKPDLNADSEKARIDNLELSNPQYLSLIPGALELLTLIPKDKWGIVTSGSDTVVNHKLLHTNIEPPHVLITGDKITEGKPNPQGYLKAASLLNIDPHYCLVFEDSPQGIRAAKAAGMKVIALKTTFPIHLLNEADACIDHFKKLAVSITNTEITISHKPIP